MKLYVCSLSALFLATIASAFASPTPGSYRALRDVQLRPSHQPRFEQGIDHLHSREMRYHESLPLQLTQPIQKISARKYR